ncbi:MAG TPA: protein kinase [Ktedonobacteraceae bacterium]|nr:protein kinase [Ktedonobacteraceae bacterium]
MSNMPGRQETPGIPQRESLIGRYLRDGEYLIQRVLGYGGMGKVYLATHASLNISLALKQARADCPLPDSVITELDYILHGSDTGHRAPAKKVREYDFPHSGGPLTDRFLREALLLARLQHPAIPTLYDYFFESGYWYLVMDYIPGLTLSAYLRQQKQIPPLEVLTYARQLCDVLDYLHRQTPPIVFRDLKPSNIILTPDGSLMLVDFGIARYFKAGQSNDTLDFGSPGYAPPEQYQVGQTDARSDLFSLGIILREMMSGQRPAGSASTMPLRNHPDISTTLNSMMTLATRSDPLHRFQSARTFYLALERTYQIEERRAYQRTLNAHMPGAVSSAVGVANGADGTKDPAAPSELSIATSAVAPSSSKSASIAPLPTLSLQQRRQTREALCHLRRERMAQETLEIHMASVDESLKRRSFKPLAPTPRLPLEEAWQSAKQPAPQPSAKPATPLPPVTARSPHRLHRASFAFILALFLVLSTFLAYLHFSDRFASVSQGATATRSAPSMTATATQDVVQTIGSHWQALPSLPSAEADNVAGYIEMYGKGGIYVSGGYRDAAHSPYYDRNLYYYDITAARWERVSNARLPGTLDNAAAVDGQGRIFFTVGYSTDSYAVTPALFMYQPASGALQSITPPPQISPGFSGAMLADQQGHLYIAQGFTKGGDPQAMAGKGWYRYNINSREWNVLAPQPTGLGYGLLASDNNGGILLLGGAQEAGQRLQTDKIYRYDIARNSWTQESAAIPLPISGAAGCQVRPGQFVIVGGYDPYTRTGMKQVWLVDLRTLHWQQLAPLPSGGSVLGAAACDGKGHLYLERGGSDPDHPTADFWELTVS